MIKLWKILFILLFIVTNYAYTDSHNQYEPIACDTCNEDCCGFRLPLPCHPPVCAYNAPDVTDTFCSYDVVLNGSYLLWAAKEDNLELGHIHRSSINFDAITSFTQPSVGFSNTILDMNFRHSPGFKAGFGAIRRVDNWELFFEFTYFDQTATTSADTSEESENSTIEAYWSYLEPTSALFTTGNSKWALRIKLFDLELARKYYVGKYLTFRTHYGLRVTRVKQSYKANYSGPRREGTSNNPPSLTRFDSSSTSRQKSWGVGPRIGLETNWKFFSGMRLFGDAAASLSYTEYNDFSIEALLQEVFLFDVVLAEQTLDTDIRHHPWYLRPQVDFDLGWAWGLYFCSNRYYVDLKVGYSFHIFFDQNIFKAYPVVTNVSQENFTRDRITNRYLNMGGNLYTHGLDISLAILF